MPSRPARASNWVLGIGAAIVIVVPLIGGGVSGAAAPPTYTVSAGSQTSGSVSFNGAALPATGLGDYRVDFTNQVTGVHFDCVSSRVAGPASLGAGLTGTLARVTKASWSPCDSFGGLRLTLTHSGSWQLRGVGVTTGNVTRMALNSVALSALGTGCTFNATGSLDATYDNATSVLELAPLAGTTRVLTISEVSGCYGAWNNGDTLTYAAQYKLATTPGAIRIVGS